MKIENFVLQVQIERTAPEGENQTVIMDYSEAAKETELTTNRMDSAGKLSFAVLEKNGISIPEGSAVELWVDGVKMFRGYILTAEQTQDGEVTYTAYDQLRYLKANASYTFENVTLGQIIQQIAADFQLTCGVLENTGYAFPCFFREDESCLDMLFDALTETIYMTGRIYNFFDNAGELTLVEAKNMYSSVLIGDKSLVTEYTYKRDIDSDTYNRVKLVRPNKETGRADTYIHEDSDNIKKWGLLQYYAKVDENMNEAQIDEMCKMYLQYYNRVLQTLDIKTLGIPGLRAGMIIPVKIGAVAAVSATRLLLTEKVSHKFEGDCHTMNLEVKDFHQLGGISLG